MHPTTSVRLHNPQPTLSSRATPQPPRPSPAVPQPAVHTTIQTHSQRSIEGSSPGMYSRLNRSIPRKTTDGNRLASTSSTNSNQPLLPSSSVEEDNAFYDDVVVMPNGCEATIAQVCRCENCNCPIHIHQPTLNQPQSVSNQPTYLQLREDTRNPSAVYETVS